MAITRPAGAPIWKCCPSWWRGATFTEADDGLTAAVKQHLEQLGPKALLPNPPEDQPPVEQVIEGFRRFVPEHVKKARLARPKPPKAGHATLTLVTPSDPDQNDAETEEVKPGADGLAALRRALAVMARRRKDRDKN